MDFSQEEDYFFYSLHFLLEDTIEPGSTVIRLTKLRINQISLEDSIVNPFEQETVYEEFL